MTDSSITVIIVNYNGGERLIRCLGALSRQSRTPGVLVVDNASQDDSLRAAYDRFPTFDYLPLRSNVGFSLAVNIGVARTEAPAIILLNPDTVPEEQFIEEIMAPLADRDIGAVAGTLVFESAPEIIASAGITMHRNGLAMDARLGEKLNHTDVMRPIFGASGGAAAFSRRAFIDAGGLPDQFFLYQEDVDLAWRLRLRGWQIVTAPKATARHTYSASAGEGSQLKRRLNARNRIWTLARCMPGELLHDRWPAIISYEAKALGYGAIRDRASLLGRAEALVKLAPRLCERRAIQRRSRVEPGALESLLEEPLSAAEQLRLRRLTRSLADAAPDARPSDRQ